MKQDRPSDPHGAPAADASTRASTPGKTTLTDTLSSEVAPGRSGEGAVASGAAPGGVEPGGGGTGRKAHRSGP
jgi:hypothetical protein